MSTTSKDPFYSSFQSISIHFSWYILVFLIDLCLFACLMLSWWFENVKYHVLDVDLCLFASIFHLVALVARFLHFKQTQKTHRPVEGASLLCKEAAPLHLTVREATPLYIEAVASLIQPSILYIFGIFLVYFLYLIPF